MNLNRRGFLTGLASTGVVLGACETPKGSRAAPKAPRPMSPIVSEDAFPAFSLEEYAQRLRRTREEMARRNIDLLYVTQPSHMCYLHGYACSWYRAAATSAWPPLAGTAVHVDHDKMIHFDMPDEIGQLEATSITRDRRIFPSEAMTSALDFLVNELTTEGWLEGSNAGLEFWSFVPSRAVSEQVEARLRGAGARDVVDGSFVLRTVQRIKSPQEIRYIEQGVQLADLGLRAAASVARPGVSENEVYGEALRAMLVAGGEMEGINQGFNVRGLPHTYSSRRRIAAGDIGGFDISGVVNRYHGNVARAYYFREPDQKTRDAYRISAEAYDIVSEVARPGVEVGVLNEALRAHFEPRGAWESVYFIGGYEIGIAFPPDWVGEWHFDAVKGVAPGVFEAGMVTNFESIFLFEDDDGEPRWTANVDTVVYGEDKTRVLSSLPREPFVIV